MIISSFGVIIVSKQKGPNKPGGAISLLTLTTSSACFINLDKWTLEEHEGDVYEAYCEVGNGEAEADVFNVIMKDVNEAFGVVNEVVEEELREWLRDLTFLNF